MCRLILSLYLAPSSVPQFAKIFYQLNHAPVLVYLSQLKALAVISKYLGIFLSPIQEKCYPTRSYVNLRPEKIADFFMNGIFPISKKHIFFGSEFLKFSVICS